MQFSDSTHYAPQTSVPILMLTNLKTGGKYKVLIAKVNAIQRLRYTYKGAPFADLKKVIEDDINACPDVACIDQIALDAGLKTCA